MRPICQACRIRVAAVNYVRKGKKYYRSKCGRCIKGQKPLRSDDASAWFKAGYRKKPFCEKCGFKAKILKQIIVYHIDGDLKNIAPNNLKSVCLNCHMELQSKGTEWKQGHLVPDIY